jgi:hypothetical protein
VETYRQALDMKAPSEDVRSTLQRCSSSHQQRVDALRNEVRRLGGTPETGSGAWGSFAKLIEGGATAFGIKAAIAALEEGEDHGVKVYEKAPTNLPPSAMSFLQKHLLPEQARTHSAMSALKARS